MRLDKEHTHASGPTKGITGVLVMAAVLLGNLVVMPSSLARNRASLTYNQDQQRITVVTPNETITVDTAQKLGSVQIKEMTLFWLRHAPDQPQDEGAFREAPVHPVVRVSSVLSSSPGVPQARPNPVPAGRRPLTEDHVAVGVDAGHSGIESLSASTTEPAEEAVNPTGAGVVAVGGLLNQGSSESQSVEPDDSPETTPPEGPTNEPPVADAGDNQIVQSGALVTLDGTGSSDPEQGSLTYGWTQSSGPTVSLNGAATAAPFFVAPIESASLVFQLVVSDPSGLPATDTVEVSVEPNVVPQIDQGTAIDLVVIQDSNAADPDNQLSLSASDSDANAGSLVWTVSVGAANGTANVVSGSPSGPGETVTVSYEPNPGTFGEDGFEVSVTDGQGEGDLIQVEVFVDRTPIVYVDQNYAGTISGPLGGPTNPHTTFAPGLDAVRVAGGTLRIVGPGSYTWDPIPNDDINQRMTIRGVGSTRPVITVVGSSIDITTAGSGSRFEHLALVSNAWLVWVANGQNASDITFEDVRFTHTATWHWSLFSASSSGAGVNDNWRVRNCVFESNADGFNSNAGFVWLRHHANLVMEGNVFHSLNGLARLGVRLDRTRGDITLRGNVFAEPGAGVLEVINTPSDTGHLDVVNNTFYGSTGTVPNEAAVREGTIDMTVVNNLFVDNLSYAVWTEVNEMNAGASWVDYNLYENNAGTSNDTWDDVSVPSDSRYTVDSFTNRKGPDVDPQFLSETYGTAGYLRVPATSPAASGAFDGLINGVPTPTQDGEAYFGAYPPQ